MPLDISKRERKEKEWVAASLTVSWEHKSKSASASDRASSHLKGHRWINKYQYLLTQSKSSNFSKTIAFVSWQKMQDRHKCSAAERWWSGMRGKRTSPKGSVAEDLCLEWESRNSTHRQRFYFAHKLEHKSLVKDCQPPSGNLNNYPACLGNLVSFNKNVGLGKLVLAASRSTQLSTVKFTTISYNCSRRNKSSRIWGKPSANPTQHCSSSKPVHTLMGPSSRKLWKAGSLLQLHAGRQTRAPKGKHTEKAAWVQHPPAYS